MHKKAFVFPVFVQAASLCAVAIWWVFFMCTQIFMVRLSESLAYRSEPPTVSAVTVQRGTERAMEYVLYGATNVQADIFFTRDEVAHLVDVSVVYKVAQLIIGVGALCGWTVLIGTLFYEKKFSGRIFLQARSTLFVIIALLLGALVLFPFFFFFFHQILFPNGNWQFPETAMLIQLFPETFWKLMLGWLMCGIFLFGLLYTLIGRMINTHESS